MRYITDYKYSEMNAFRRLRDEKAERDKNKLKTNLANHMETRKRYHSDDEYLE